jgi:putative YhbY family RNA-binding protein
MPPLDSAARRALRARAHHLDPVVSIGQQGLTPTVVHEIDGALRAHELIKIRVFSDDREARGALLETVCAAVDAAPVQHLGKLFVIWRPNPEAAKPAARKTGTERPRRAGKPGGGAKRPPESNRRDARKSRGIDAKAQGAHKTRRADVDTMDAGGSSRRRRGTGNASRPAPPAGVPRAALPRRRRGP